MSISETIKAELEKARGELRDAATTARRAADDRKTEIHSRVAKARDKRDTLRAQVHHDLYTQLQSLEAEKEKLSAAAHALTGTARAKTEERIREVETKLRVTRDEFVAHADLTLDEIDDELVALETKAKASRPEGRDKAQRTVNELKAKRDELREKAAKLRAATGASLKKASDEFDDVMADLTYKRNEAMVGVN